MKKYDVQLNNSQLKRENRYQLREAKKTFPSKTIYSNASDKSTNYQLTFFQPPDLQPIESCSYRPATWRMKTFSQKIVGGLLFTGTICSLVAPMEGKFVRKSHKEEQTALDLHQTDLPHDHADGLLKTMLPSATLDMGTTSSLSTTNFHDNVCNVNKLLTFPDGTREVPIKCSKKHFQH